MLHILLTGHSHFLYTAPSPLMPEQASLFRSGIPCDSPLNGHSLWGLTFITPGLARSYLFYFFNFYTAPSHAAAVVFQASRWTQPTMRRLVHSSLCALLQWRTWQPLEQYAFVLHGHVSSSLSLFSASFLVKLLHSAQPNTCAVKPPAASHKVGCYTFEAPCILMKAHISKVVRARLQANVQPYRMAMIVMQAALWPQSLAYSSA